MSNEDVGKYIRLLCLQHQKGRLSEKTMKNICSTYVEDIYSKFLKDENGLYYNQRLENEALKRKEYSESRRQNVLSRYKKSVKGKPVKTKKKSTYVLHMGDGNGNVNRDIDVDNIKVYFKELGHPDQAEPFYDFYQSKGWKVGKAPMKDWKAAARNWCRRSFDKKKVETPEHKFAKEPEVNIDNSPEGQAKVKRLIDKALGR